MHANHGYPKVPVNGFLGSSHFEIGQMALRPTLTYFGLPARRRLESQRFQALLSTG